MIAFKLKTLLGALVLALLVIQTAQADNYLAYAQVTRVDPVYERISRRIPETSCHIETRTYRETTGGNSHTGTIVGGIPGAALGNELGHKKRNKQVGAVAGGLLGASIGRDLSQRGKTTQIRHRDEEVCATHYRTEAARQLVGYRVSYTYMGRDYQTRADRHPGDRIPISVSVRPAL